MSAETNESVTYRRDGTQWFRPVLWSAATLARLSARTANWQAVLGTLRRLTPDDYLEFVCAYVEKGLERFGDDWGYTDLLSVTQAAATALRPRRYLEIGVRRGRSLGVVAAAWPEVELLGFDLWIPNYAYMENPGPAFVEAEVRRLGHRGRLELVSGDSRETVPAYLEAHPGACFDLVTVDGDHTPAGAAADLANVLPRVSVGGVVVLDDVAHPLHRDLEPVWEELVASNPAFDSAIYRELGYGVAFAVRREA